ncbi:unnamed protein product [Rotaria socialis]|uniref:Uncharacterized protein n=1 Tax=Rotaria socialis TaxID=392032 RepID=A0A821HCD6_9BILA|nr:unnamed protein product [Rotaria socialis]CAF4682895.1 unnamed protein product [Rotaria socialis]
MAENNITSLISCSKKRSLNPTKLNPFRDFTVVKSNNPTSQSSSAMEELTATEDSTANAKVKFTVVLPPKKSSPSRETEEDDEGEHRSKRQRRRSQDTDEDRQHKEKPHFTVTIDPASKHTKHSRNKTHETSKANKNNDGDNDTSALVTDARQILERKRRNRR